MCSHEGTPCKKQVPKQKSLKSKEKMFLDMLLGLECIDLLVHCTVLTFVVFPSEGFKGRLVSALTN